MLRRLAATTIGKAIVKGGGHWTIDPETGKGAEQLAAGKDLTVVGDGWMHRPWPGYPTPAGKPGPAILEVGWQGETRYVLQADTDWPKGYTEPGVGSPREYPVTVGGKAAGKVTLP
jgi:hypothetical protein